MSLAIKEETKELEQLLKISQPISQSVVQAVDDTPEELQEPEPLFTLDYEKEKKMLMKKARASISKIAKTIIPKAYINHEYVQDHINQNAEQLSSLFWQKMCIEIMQKTLMETVAHGNASPRYFETFSQISKNHSDIADQISKQETFVRKDFLDLKYTLIEAKEDEEMDSMKMTPKAIENKPESQVQEGYLISSNKEFIKEQKAEKLRRMKEMQEHNAPNAIEVVMEEVKEGN